MTASAVIEMPKLSFPEPLADRYRPRRIADFAGLAKPKAVLEKFIQRPYPSAWLFLGPSGVGKTTMGLVIGQALGAELHHIPSRKCDLETVEDVARRCHYVPMRGRLGFHLVLVDEADQMTQAAQLAFLSKLDATAFPPSTIFVFTANDTALLEPRFLSRCRLLEFNVAGLEADLPELLRRVQEQEGKAGRLDLSRLAQQAGYNVRDALMKLEIELMAGDLASDPTPSEQEHSHTCPKCRADWLCDQAGCEIRHTAVCRNCGAGTKTVGQERAEKAVATRKRNLAKMLRQARKVQRRKRAS